MEVDVDILTRIYSMLILIDGDSERLDLGESLPTPRVHMIGFIRYMVLFDFSLSFIYLL